MVNWDSLPDLSARLSQLPIVQQEALQVQLSSLILPGAPTWKLVILNNRDGRQWGISWPHQLAHERPTGAPGDNTLVNITTNLTFVRIGLLPLANQGPSQHENVTMTLHDALTGVEITAALAGRPLFLMTRAGSVVLPQPQVLAAAVDPLVQMGAEEPHPLNLPGAPGLLNRVNGRHSFPELHHPPKWPARLAALQQASADLQEQGKTETTFKFCFNVTPAGIAGCNAQTLVKLRFTLGSDLRVFVDTEPFRLMATKGNFPTTGGKERMAPGDDGDDGGGGGKRQKKGAGTSAGAGPSSHGAAVPSNSLPSQAEAMNSFMAQLQDPLLQLPPPAVQAPGQQTPAGLSLQDQVLQTAGLIGDDDDLGELGNFDAEPHLEANFPEGQPPNDDEGGGAGHTDISAGGADSFQACSAVDDSAPPSFTACSAPESGAEGAGAAYRSLGATSGGDAGGEAGLQRQQLAMRRIRRAKRDTARAQLLAIVRAASAQQQQQPGAMPLAQLKEELENLKAWLGP